MAGICSRHQGYDAECAACNAMPWDLLKTTKEEWDAKMAEAEASGIVKCQKCGFEQYNNHEKCISCQNLLHEVPVELQKSEQQVRIELLIAHRKTLDAIINENIDWWAKNRERYDSTWTVPKNAKIDICSNYIKVSWYNTWFGETESFLCPLCILWLSKEERGAI